ncbi:MULTISPECIES: hypothetical protein [Halocynthiibacter]|uniref:Uncharacterized protein n=1 Tax=Halocynthiibacter halioticoli TaxID=2986804 RepID=A0AAE3J2W4_9RHOB|nr:MULTISPECIES: hypothetical protein [Halocynthiibacter]MCV6825331.1 hypothetical protein [Halocynthiibacter halioticoli]MCW4058332.1 hypothetical protein [Halocynthiibacter sp. SDUM655004]
MRYKSFRDFLQADKAALSNGPIAIILVEDLIEVASTIEHHLNLGFRTALVFAPDALELSDELESKIHRISAAITTPQTAADIVNSVISAANGTWLYYCFNAEYLFFPFCESRTIGEMLAWHSEERRDSVLTYVVDLYAADLSQHPDAVSKEDAHLDKSGYYALARKDSLNRDHPKDRQLDFFGGLRWRFEEHIPQKRRRIDRISIFRAKPGLLLNEDHTFNDEEYNTYSCAWHHNITAAVCSFKTAKALKLNPGSTFDIDTFKWHNSVPFTWESQQLLDLGLMEPGQWF